MGAILLIDYSDDKVESVRRLIASVVLSFVALFVMAGASRAQSPDWTEPFPPFRIAGNLYYVGSKDLATYLITTPQGHILINSDLVESVPLIRASVEKLGFKFSDIRILLISHAHWDHDGGSAEIKRLTGAKYMVMDADVSVVESGGKTDFQYGNVPASLYPPTKVDRVLHDGDEVKLGAATLVAHLTPGHTKGCTTWTMKVEDAGKVYDVVIIGSPNVNEGYKLVNNSSYPEIESDYERTFRVLKSLPVDIFLGAHGSYFDLETKYARLKEAAVNPFIDPAGYKSYATDREAAFRTELAKQKAAPQPGAPPLQSGDSLWLGRIAREVGSEVRISIPSNGRVEGRLVEVGPGILRLDQGAGPRTLPFSLRDTLWVKEPVGWTGATYGAVAGLAAAGAVLLLFRSMCGPGGDDPCTGFGKATLILGTGGAVFGAGAGLMAGQFIKHWVRRSP